MLLLETQQWTSQMQVLVVKMSIEPPCSAVWFVIYLVCVRWCGTVILNGLIVQLWLGGAEILRILSVAASRVCHDQRRGFMFAGGLVSRKAA